jgi:hypothetical protein
LNSVARVGTPISKSKKIREGMIYSDRRNTNGAINSSCKGEYDAAIVVHATERKIRFNPVDHELNIGMARKEPSGNAMGARMEERSAPMVCCWQRCFQAYVWVEDNVAKTIGEKCMWNVM